MAMGPNVPGSNASRLERVTRVNLETESKQNLLKSWTSKPHDQLQSCCKCSFICSHASRALDRLWVTSSGRSSSGSSERPPERSQQSVCCPRSDTSTRSSHTRFVSALAQAAGDMKKQTKTYYGPYELGDWLCEQGRFGLKTLGSPGGAIRTPARSL